MEGGVKMGLLENFMRTHQNSLKSLFQRNKSAGANEENDSSSSHSPRPIPQLSALANSVVSRCSKILKVSTEELQHCFDIELPESVKQLFTYARNFLEFCSYQALHQLMRHPDYLSDPGFRRLTYDMMLAWEAPCVESEPQHKETVSSSNQEVDDEDGWSLFYSSSTNMAVQVDDKKTVGPEAFARIAPVCATIADVISVRNLFDALTSSSGHRLHFLIYDKYLHALDKITKAAKNALGPSVSSLQLAEGEIILDVDGAVPVQPVLKHIGISAWPAVRYDLAMDMKQVIKPELTGPLGARLFDKAVMYKSTSISEPVYFEFPEFKGNSRRDYWLDICLEIMRAHRFLEKHNFKEIQQSEVLARAILGIFRYRAVREAFHVYSSQYKTLLTFNLAESLPGGDTILGTLSSRLALITISASPRETSGMQYMKWPLTLSPVSLLTLKQFGLTLQREVNLEEETAIVGDFCIGETSPLEIAVKQSMSDTGRAEAAQATVDQVKVEGIDTNVALLKELLFPVIARSQQLVMEANGLEPLLANFTSDSDVTVRTKALGAISSLIRHNKPAITAFRLANGYAGLRDALGSESVRFQRKALNLIHYLLHENSSDCDIVSELGFPRIMMHLASSEDAEVREAALRGLLELARDKADESSSRLAEENEGLKQLLEERIKGISLMSPEDLGASREERHLVDSIWNTCYKEPSSLREKSLLVLPGEDAPPPDVASKHFEPPFRAWAASHGANSNSNSGKKQTPLLLGSAPPAEAANDQSTSSSGQDVDGQTNPLR